MFKSYFILGWRNIWQHKTYALINIGGLVIGLTCFIMVMLYVQLELSFDQFHSKAERIYLVSQWQSRNAFLEDHFAVTPVQLASNLKDEFAEVEQAISLRGEETLLSRKGQSFLERGLVAGPELLTIFSFEVLSGNPSTMLSKPKNIVLTASLAKKLFAGAEALEQTIQYQQELFVVSGIVADPPLNSSLQFSFVASIHSFPWYVNELKRPRWHNNNVQTFLLLNEQASASDLESKFPPFIKKYAASHDAYKDSFSLHPLPSLHLAQDINLDIGLKGNRNVIYIFSAVALAVLLLACVNYMNLAVARSIRRAREVGIRKVVGAVRAQILRQFLGESLFLTSLSMMIAIVLTLLLLPRFSHLVERDISFDVLQNPWLILGLMLIVILTGLLTGCYPSLVISSLRPVQILKGKIDSRLSSFRLQRLLIVAQFTVSIILIVSAITIYRQIQYMNSKELGYDRSGVITVSVRDRELMNHLESMIQEWQTFPGVTVATSTIHLPTNITSSTVINDEDGSEKEDDLTIYQWDVNYNFEDVFGIKLASGRTFSITSRQDATESIMLNETAAHALGWTATEAIGKKFIHDGWKTVIGVIKDFHMHSLYLPIKPLLVRMEPHWANFMSIKMDQRFSHATLSLLQHSMKKYSAYPFEYQFLDDHFKRLYSSEARLNELFGFVTAVAIFLASLGLFGLAAFSVSQRTKEIGIRKVLGASSPAVVTLLTQYFVRPVLLSFLLAVPASWYGTQRWLGGFAYRVDIDLWTFILAGSLALLFAIIAVSHQSIHAAFLNPVESLKSE